MFGSDYVTTIFYLPLLILPRYRQLRAYHRVDWDKFLKIIQETSFEFSHHNSPADIDQTINNHHNTMKKVLNAGRHDKIRPQETKSIVYPWYPQRIQTARMPLQPEPKRLYKLHHLQWIPNSKELVAKISLQSQDTIQPSPVLNKKSNKSMERNSQQ